MPGGTVEIIDEAAAFVDVEEGWSRFGLNRLVFRLKDRNMRNRTVARLAQVIRDTTGGQPTVGELTQQKKERALPLAFKDKPIQLGLPYDSRKCPRFQLSMYEEGNSGGCFSKIKR